MKSQRRLALGRAATFVAMAPLVVPHAIVPSVRAIADNYDAFLLDQFGVLHDGQKPLQGAVHCFEKLARSGKKLVVLSNTSRRRGFAIKKFPKIGFDDELLTGFCCSGEAAWEHTLEHYAGRKCLYLSWAESFHAYDPAYLDGLDLTLAAADEADFILCHGSHDIRDGAGVRSSGVFATGQPNRALDAALRTCADRGVPLICANPDFAVTLPDGTRGHMPGLIAKAYEEVGGVVTYFGKPHAAAFAGALKLLGEGVEPSRVLHVGDSLMHDIRGANDAGVHSLFVASGIHAQELGIPEGAADGASGASGHEEATALLASRADALERLFQEYGARPSLSASAFVW